MLRWLFLDMNSYFASVEQQMRPELRGKPVAVAAVHTDSTACIAASYEAKAFGVKTGTNVGMARHMCPGLNVVPARPELYVEVHKKICATVENHLHVDKVLSIDEMACRLPSNENSEERVRAIARAIKESLRRNLGDFIRCSIGIAPNRYLSKVASDMQKPDGLTILHSANLEEKILQLEVRDFPGIAGSMQLRLAAAGADTVRALWNFTPEQMARAWGGICGRQFWHNLHGDNVVELPTQRHSISHSSVLSPERRTDEGAFAILIRLVHKAGARLRDMGYAAGNLSLHLRYTNNTAWNAQLRIDDAQDTQTLIEAMEYLWMRRPKLAGVQMPLHAGTTPARAVTLKKVGMALFDLELAANATLPLFGGDTKRLELAHAMDHINARYGRQRIYFAEMHGTRKSAPMRIAFNSVPDENW